MIYMTPYEKPAYFILLAITLLPIIVGLLKGKRWLWYQNIVTIFFLWLSFGGVNKQQGYALILFVLWQTALIWVYFHHRQKANSTSKFYLAVFLSIFPLILVKVIPFIEKHFLNTEFLAATDQPKLLFVQSWVGFLGVSYLTFKAVQMIMEMRDGTIKEYRIDRFWQFLIFFPTISSGPIDRYRRFEKDLLNPPEPTKYADMLNRGIFYIFLGFLYKYLLGYMLGSYLYPIVQKFALDQGGIPLGLLGVMYTYSLYLFFDFAGYSLFAVGVSNLMGYDTPMNFNKPFISHNIKDFWNRWHMTLSFWFRDFIYMRLMFTLMKKKVFKSRIVTSNVGYFALFLIMGLWHGLTWYYIAYGLYHATLICLTDVWIRFKRKHKKQIPSNRFTKAFSIFLTFHAVCFSFLIFSGFLDKLFFHNIM